MVKVIFLGPFGRFMPNEEDDGYWHLDAAGQTVESIIEKTDIKYSKMNYSVIINDERQDKNYCLQDGDELSIIPIFIAG